MKKLHSLFSKSAWALAFAAALSVNVVTAQTTIDQQPSQGAQMTHKENVQQSVSQEVVATETITPKGEKSAPQILVPQNASPKQARQIVKANKMLEKAAADRNVQQPNGLQKSVLRKLTKKLDKLGVEETSEIKAIKDASAAQANKNVTLGIVLAAVGLLFSLLFGGILGILGIILLIVGVVLLILGLVE